MSLLILNTMKLRLNQFIDQVIPNLVLGYEIKEDLELGLDAKERIKLYISLFGS